ncbi:MAG: AAA family ATPase [Congregibacter sp.]
MYHQYFGLAEAPFSIAVNPRYLYMSPRHRDALAHLLYGVGAGGGFILLTGEVGTGKTTINRCLLEQLPDNADIAIVLNPALDARDLLATVCDELGIEFSETQPGLKSLTDSLHRFLLDNHARQRKTVLMIDEAQHLGFGVLEQIRLLTNLETNEEKLLHIILIGQPELAEKLSRPELRQLNQRITARFDLRPLNLAEAGAYIRHRLHVAGLAGGTELFAPSLVRAIHSRSRGVPRLINLLCDRMLLGAYGRNSTQLDRSLLNEAAREVLGSGEGLAENRRYGLERILPNGLSGAGLLAAVLACVLLGIGVRSYLASTSNVPAVTADAVPSAPLVPESRVASEAIPTVVANATPETSSRWRLSSAEGVQLLAALYDVAVEASTVDPCRLALPDELRCERLRIRSWNQLLEDPRPALLSLVDARRFEASALFLGVEEELAVLATATGLQRIPLAELAPGWTGEYWRLWRNPLEQGRLLKAGDQGADVRELAGMFAAIDKQATPLSRGEFNTSLESRLRLFQEEQGLRADGILGAQTLRALTLAAGRDLDFLRARQQFERLESERELL